MITLVTNAELFPMTPENIAIWSARKDLAARQTKRADLAASLARQVSSEEMDVAAKGRAADRLNQKLERFDRAAIAADSDVLGAPNLDVIARQSDTPLDDHYAREAAIHQYQRASESLAETKDQWTDAIAAASRGPVGAEYIGSIMARFPDTIPLTGDGFVTPDGKVFSSRNEAQNWNKREHLAAIAALHARSDAKKEEAKAVLAAPAGTNLKWGTAIAKKVENRGENVLLDSGYAPAAYHLARV